jgi:MFS family permease
VLETEPAVMPPGLHQAYWFAVFNAFSFQIVLNSPMVLYGKALGASATVLGIITGMMPLLVIFQIPAAHHIERVGYKRFVYAGWGTRVTFIFGLALVPLTFAFLNPTTRLALLLLLLFGFNLSRGISSAGWLPWITSLVPARRRGAYLARDAACMNLASFFTFVLAAWLLGNKPGSWQFAALFAFSACMGAVSLVFLKRIPEAQAREEAARSCNTPVPWLAMVRYEPFTRLLKMVIAWSMAYGGLTTFTVAFLKTEAAMSERAILLVTSVSFLGGWGSLWFIGSRLDKLGSKPVLGFSFVTWMGIVSGWGLVAGKVVAPGILLILALQVLMGLFYALVQMSNTRLAMTLVPVMGRNHFFAMYSVIGSVALGLSPILWGLMIDAVGARRIRWLGLEWNRYTLFFAAVTVAFFLALALARRLREPQAASLEELIKDLLIESPQRVWMRLWLRE